MKKIISILLMLVPIAVMAQSGTNSPYSQYGLGILSDQSTGFNRGMNGLAIAMHDGGQVNYLNPASYANMDSLTFLFDVGASIQATNFSENGIKLNANNANFDYAVMGFRVAKNLGMSIGVLPFTNIGYNYSGTNKVSENSTTTHTETYSGSGGLRQMYVGLGYMLFKGLSVGANISYLWGNYDRYMTNSYSDSNVKTITRLYFAEPSSYRLDAGIQYTFNISKKDAVTLGATYTNGHKLNGTVGMLDISSGSTSVVDTTSTYLSNSLSIPDMIGGGIAWHHGTKLHVGADYVLQQWGKLKFPELTGSDGNSQLELKDNLLMDRHKLTVGAEFVNNINSRRYLDRVHVRAGVSYATPYFKVNGQDGPKDMSVSLGFGLPITNSWNNRSTLNISGQWVRSSAPDSQRQS